MRETAVREFTEESLGVVRDARDMENTLAARDYWIRVVLKINHDRRAERYHATYVVPVAWDATLPQRFLNTRLDIEHVDRAAQEWRYARPQALGPGSVGLVRAVDEDGSVMVIGEDEEEDTLRRFEEPLTVCAVLEWQRHRDRVERSLVTHPGVTVQRCARNLLQSVDVNKDHLEKDQVRWWTEAELRQVIEEHGRL